MKHITISIVTPRVSMQSASLQEPVEEGFEVKQALAYFGFKESDVDWVHKGDHVLIDQSHATTYCGIIKGTTRIVNIVIS